jgi:hypothetical protein
MRWIRVERAVASCTQIRKFAPPRPRPRPARASSVSRTASPQSQRNTRIAQWLTQSPHLTTAPRTLLQKPPLSPLRSRLPPFAKNFGKQSTNLQPFSSTTPHLHHTQRTTRRTLGQTNLARGAMVRRFCFRMSRSVSRGKCSVVFGAQCLPARRRATESAGCDGHPCCGYAPPRDWLCVEHIFMAMRWLPSDSQLFVL